MRRAAILVAALSVIGAAPAVAQETAVTRANLEAAAAGGQAAPAESRALGEFYATGRDGKKDPKAAMRLWKAAADAGDPRAPILIADRLYDEIWGRPQADGSRIRTGRLPAAKAEEAARWYRLAFERDDRAEVRSRAQVLGASLTMALEAQRR